MIRGYQRTLGLLALALLAPTVLCQKYWPQWRGPEFSGVSREMGLPTTWSESENIAWKTPLPSWSGSTPIVWGDSVFVTSPSKGGPDDPGADATRPAAGPELLLLCINRKDGAILWERCLNTGNKDVGKQNDTSPSPVTDGKHVWALTGTGTLAGFTMNGDPLWKRNVQKDYCAFGLNFGYGSSPLLLDGKVIVQVLHGYTTDEPSWLGAFDGLTGEPVWHVERPTDAPLESPDAYTTPVVVNHDGRNLIVLSGGDYVTAHDPDTGVEVWRAAGLNPKKGERNRMIASPVAYRGMVYAMSTRQPLLAIRADGTGDVTANHTIWTWSGKDGPDVPTPACDGNYLYLVSDRGMVTCLYPMTGKTVWGPERTAKGVVSASPLLADGKLYVTNEEAVTTVLKAGPEFEVLATNTLDSSFTLSSIAVAEGQLFLRTATHLYCIGKSGK